MTILGEGRLWAVVNTNGGKVIVRIIMVSAKRDKRSVFGFASNLNLYHEVCTETTES
jgi:hypothetical protein